MRVLSSTGVVFDEFVLTQNDVKIYVNFGVDFVAVC